MTGTILFTGANGSLAIPAVEYLLSRYPNFAVILTVRDDSDQDTNTVALRKVVARHPDINVSIRKLDLGSLKEAQSFSEALRSEIEEKKLPRIATIICNAMTWKLSGGPALTADGFESAMAINHLSQFAMVLRLLSAMDTQRGRVVFPGSEAHRPEKAGLSQGFPTKLPADLDALVHPPQDEKGKELGQGFRRYALSKLVIVMVAYELNRRLKENEHTRSIRVITVDPGNLLNSSTFFREHVPWSVRILFTIISWFQPVLKFMSPQFMLVKQAAPPFIDVAVTDEFAGREGYFESKLQVESSPDSRDEEMQKELWKRSVAWCGLRQEDTVVDL